MVFRKLWVWTGFLAVLAAAFPASAGPISANSTGDVEKDFPSNQPGITTLINPQFPSTNAEQYILSHHMSTGWSIKDIRLYYDKSTDTMEVGVNFFGVAGDADSNGNPGTVSSQTAAAGGIDLPHLGGRESITIGFDFTNSGKPTVLAGVPGDKSQAGPGIDGFTIATYANNGMGFANSYGTYLPGHMGGLVFDPSPQHPDFEFLITNFSKLPGYNPTTGFGLMAFAGSPDDMVEEEGVVFPRVDAGQIPEPATLLAWSIVAGGAAIRLRRRRSRS